MSGERPAIGTLGEAVTGITVTGVTPGRARFGDEVFEARQTARRFGAVERWSSPAMGCLA